MTQFLYVGLIAVIYRTSEAPPITYPSNLGGGGGKVGTVNITWDPMPVSEWNAGQSSVGYIVSWKKAGMTDEQWDSVSYQRYLIFSVFEDIRVLSHFESCFDHAVARCLRTA